MAIISAVQPKFISFKNDGSPNSLGTVGFYTAGTSFAAGNEITIWDTVTKDSTLTNPVTLDSDGTKEVWFDVSCDIEELDSDGNALANGQTLAVDPNTATTSTGNYNSVVNGSFEVGTTVPDNWTLSAETGGTIAIDATSGGQAHGDQGLKFTGSTNGGGTATSDFFSVNSSAAVKTVFTYKSTISTVTNTVKIYWFQYDDTASATASTTVYTATSGHPSSFTTYIRGAAVPSDAVKAKIELTGVGSSGTTKVGPTWFDDVQVINIPIDDIIYDSNGNEVLTTVATASAVNNPRFTNATTGNAATIDVTETNSPLAVKGNGTGELQLTKVSLQDTDILDSNNNEAITIVATASAVNNPRFTNATTGNAAKIDCTETNSDLDLASNGTGDVTKDGSPIARIVLGTPVASTSGTVVDFTSIPSWAKRITVSYQGVSTDGSSNLQLRIGDSGGIEATGYKQAGSYFVTASNPIVEFSTTGFDINDAPLGAVSYGQLTLVLLDSSNFIWSCSGAGYSDDATDASLLTGGTKALSAALDRVQITTVSADDFTAGSVNILYEG